MKSSTAFRAFTEIAAIIAGFYLLMGINVLFGLGGIGSGPLESKGVAAALLFLASPPSRAGLGRRQAGATNRTCAPQAPVSRPPHPPR